MTDAKEDKKETLGVSAPTRLSLTKTVESGKVKQNFTYGRSKTVTVEVRKTRTFTTSKDGSAMVEVKKPLPGMAQDAPRSEAMTQEEALRGLTEDERQARLRALKFAEETSRSGGDDRPAASALWASETATQDAPAAPRSGIVTPRKNVVTPKVLPQDALPATPEEAEAKSRKLGIAPPPRSGKLSMPGDDDESRAEKEKAAKARVRREEPRRNSGKITVTQALSLSEERVRSLAAMRRQREKSRKVDSGGSQEKITRDVVIPEAITVQELANRMAERAVDVVKILMKLGTMATVNQTIDADTAELIATEMGHKPKRVTEGDVENILKDEVEENAGDLLPRAPVVTIMGHVDHGKTSLLDALRKTDVVAGEAGGITQHIGAYQVQLGSGDKITFLDTPGHEAFTSMRARGAKVTDIVVLVVAADDGIMAQTVEAISHAKAAGVPIIVAINKIDKPGADPARVRTELMNHELVPEEFGGDVMTVEVSAKEGTGLDKLQETILLQSEVLELKANPNRAASGAVIEAKMDRGRGVVATVLIQKGTVRVGDIVVAGAAYGKVRAIMDDKGKLIERAGPSMPVEIQGLGEVPDAGDEFAAVESEKVARDITEYRAKRGKAALHALGAKTMEQLFAGVAVKELPVIVKADVHGSMEAIVASINKLSNEEVSVRVLHSAVGAITESDISLAGATGAILVGFNVRATAQAKAMAERNKVAIRYYSIIYNVVDDVKAALSGLLSPTLSENLLGYAEIRQVFTITKSGKVAGCMVTEGMIKRGAKVRLLRDNVVIHEGTLKTLKRFKDEVKEVKSGFECGMAFENYEDIREGDMIEAFEVESVARTIA